MGVNHELAGRIAMKQELGGRVALKQELGGRRGMKQELEIIEMYPSEIDVRRN